MISIYIFAISGVSIITLVAAKRLEEKRKKSFFISRAISSGDIYVRALYHKLVHWYWVGKEKAHFFYKKQLPIHSKNILNKTVAYLDDKRQQYTENMRDAKLLKKSDGISEFFRNMSDIEKGNGVIHDDLHKDSQN